MSEKLFDQEEVWLGVEGGVESEDWSRAFKAVAWEVEFGHRVY